TLVALATIGVALWAFVEIVDGYLNEATVLQIDTLVQQLAEDIATPRMASAMARVTNFAAPVLVVVVTVGLATFFAVRRLWSSLLTLGLALGVGEVLLYTLKLTFGRTRPTVGDAHDGFGASFPSGHAFTALVLYGL